MTIADLASMSKGERLAWELEDAEREFRLFDYLSLNAHEKFDRIKAIEAKFHRTAEGINALYEAGHTELATANAIALGYRGNAAAIRARSSARKTAEALDEMRQTKEELVAATAELAAAKQKRTKERAQEKVDSALARMNDLSEVVRQHATQAREEAIAANQKAERVTWQTTSAQRAEEAAYSASVKASLAATMLDEAVALASGEEQEDESTLPNDLEELSGEADFLDDADYDDNEEEGEVEFF